MAFALEEIHNQNTWDALVLREPWTPFTQSWSWGEFQKTQGHRVWRFLLKEAGEPLVACQLQQNRRSLGVNYLVGVRGPIFFASAQPRLREVFHAFLTELTRRDFPGYNLFFRFEPPIVAEIGKEIMPLRMVRTHAWSPAATRRLSLQESEDALLADMHAKTRYNVRVAQKHSIDVRIGNQSDDLETFLRLTKETGERDAFTPLQETYLRATYDALAPLGMARLRFAEKEGDVLAANMEILYGDTVTYLHGASSSRERQLMAPYAAHWDAVQAAKLEGYQYYDLWGCNPELTSNYYYKKSWDGISRFKQGWGGELIELIGTWDLPVNRLLYVVAFPKTLRR